MVSVASGAQRFMSTRAEKPAVQQPPPPPSRAAYPAYPARQMEASFSIPSRSSVSDSVNSARYFMSTRAEKPAVQQPPPPPSRAAYPARQMEASFSIPSRSSMSASVKTWSPTDDDIIGTPWYECPGTLNGSIPVNALPDYGSSVNTVSEAFATRHKLRVIHTPMQPISLVGDNRAESIGHVFVNFQFQGEQQSYRREFHVLRKSVCDIILGKSFLAETETLTKFTRRITERVRLGIRRRDRLFLLDESPKDRIRCSVNGTAATAVPDTGSDLMLISAEFAERHGFKIHRGKKHRREVELVDGSTVWTDGMVRGAKLDFEVPWDKLQSVDYEQYLEHTAGLSARASQGPVTTTFICDLHVVEDLPCDIILSNEFIFKNNVFTRFQGLFMSGAGDECPGARMIPKDSILFIRKRSKWWRSKWRRAQSSRSATATPNHAPATSWREKWLVEEEKRNEWDRLWLTMLPMEQRPGGWEVEWTIELERRAAWDRDNLRP
ncbi:hypothetical protein QBC39DRAFT_137574 [Podospora conica]|nr:hypothetical protein QBC39DRAFT_137574 [Schizothecium conicum]